MRISSMTTYFSEIGNRLGILTIFSQGNPTLTDFPLPQFQNSPLKPAENSNNPNLRERKGKMEGTAERETFSPPHPLSFGLVLQDLHFSPSSVAFSLS